MAAEPGCERRESTQHDLTAAPLSAIFLIHRTTVALAWQTGVACAFGGWDGPGCAGRKTVAVMSAYSFGPWFWSPNKWFSWSVL